jgi:hypothetical protein
MIERAIPFFIGYVVLGIVTGIRGWKWWEAGLLGIAIGLIAIGWAK